MVSEKNLKQLFFKCFYGIFRGIEESGREMETLMRNISHYLLQAPYWVWCVS